MTTDLAIAYLLGFVGFFGVACLVGYFT